MANNIDLFFINCDNKLFAEDTIINMIDTILKKRGIDNWELSVTFCDDDYIRQLNKEYRKKDEATDILTFNLFEEDIPQSVIHQDEGISAGDIIISLQTVKNNSRYFELPLEEEMKRVLIHGLLHLQGMNHPEDDYDFTCEMLRLQESILKEFTEVKILTGL